MPGISSEIATGMTEDYHPWIGAETPTLTIEEYSDYQCFQCYKMHFMLRRLMTRYPDKIRLIHRHFPMDKTVNEIIVPTPFHIGAGKMALMAIYASTQKKFWQTNDALFELGRDKKTFNTRILADKTGLTAGALAAATRDQTLRKFLQNDIREGMLLGITGTPSFVIDGQVYPGAIPAEILKKAIE
jgi:protein-disulfide isomerase